MARRNRIPQPLVVNAESEPDPQDPNEPMELAVGGESPDGGMTAEDDGSLTVDLGPPAISPAAAQDHNANLADDMDEGEINRVTGELIEKLDDDIASRADWDKAGADGIKLLGLKVEQRTVPYKDACGVFDPLMAEAVIRFQANARGELLPAGGPVKTQIVGEESDDVRAQARRVKDWMNFYLTKIATEYYPDYDQMLFWLPLAGSTFKKVYFDPYLNRPTAPFIMPEQFVVSWTTTDLGTCQRATHISLMPKRDVVWRQYNGVYRNVALGEPNEQGQQTEIEKARDKAQGTTQILARGDDRYQILEIHADLDIKGLEHKGEDGKPTGMPLPYIVTADRESKKCLAIRRNWREGDDRHFKRRYFVHYKYLPGPGFYGIGLAHILGGYATASTQILRILIDTGVINAFPGGMRVKGMRIESPGVTIGPNEWIEIDTGGLKLSEAFAPVPSKEPSVVLKDLRTEFTEGARRLGSMPDIAVGEGRQDAPVGTTVALMDAATKVESAVIKRAYVSQTEEFGMMHDLFGETLPETPYPYAVRGGNQFIMRADFNGRVGVIPVGDPNVPSSSQRMIRAEGMTRMAATFPQHMNALEALRRMLDAWGVDDPEKLLNMPPQAVPMDPVSENQIALQNGPLAVGPWQDDDSHIAVHSALIETAPQIMAHISDHLGSKFRKAAEQAIGQPLPPLGQKLPPQLENQIALKVAQSIDQIKQMMAGQAAPQMDPMQVAMADIAVKQAAVDQKAKAAADKTEADAVKTGLEHMDKQAQLQTKVQVAAMQAQAGIERERMKPTPQGGGAKKGS